MGLADFSDLLKFICMKIQATNYGKLQAKKKKKELNEELKDVNDEMRLQRNSFRCIFEKF